MGSGNSGYVSMYLYDQISTFVKYIDLSVYISGPNQITIDLADLSDGLYFYKLQTTDNLYTGTLIKNNGLFR